MARKLTTDDFKQKVKEMYGDEYTVLGEYINTKTKIRIRHNCSKCNNYEYSITPNHFLSGRKCEKCSKINFKTSIAPKKTTKQFKQEVFDLVGTEYTVLGDYIDTHTDILMRHNSNKCSNHEYMVAPTEFLSGNRCPKCKGINHSKNKSLNLDDVISELNELDATYKVSHNQEYVNNKQNIKMKCPKGHTVSISLVNFRAGHRCPICCFESQSSKKEKELADFIELL